MTLPERFHATLRTEMGWVAVLATPRGLRHLTLPKPTREEALDQLLNEERSIGEERPDLLQDVLSRLSAYYRGEVVDLSTLLLDMEQRPPFYRRVWEELRRLPRGEVLTYGELASRVGNPHAARAVGQAMAANPYPPVVPCHRVVGYGGRLTGFGGGLDLKVRLLHMEGRQVRGHRN